MLKWLSGSASSGANGNGGNFDNLTHVGKVYMINRHQVVVEEVIAEGMATPIEILVVVLICVPYSRAHPLWSSTGQFGVQFGVRRNTMMCSEVF